jgi:hypothetical protein
MSHDAGHAARSLVTDLVGEVLDELKHLPRGTTVGDVLRRRATSGDARAVAVLKDIESDPKVTILNSSLGKPGE